MNSGCHPRYLIPLPLAEGTRSRRCWEAWWALLCDPVCSALTQGWLCDSLARSFSDFDLLAVYGRRRGSAKLPSPLVLLRRRFYLSISEVRYLISRLFAFSALALSYPLPFFPSLTFELLPPPVCSSYLILLLLSEVTRSRYYWEAW